LPILALEAVLALGRVGIVGGAGAIGWRLDALQRFAYVPQLPRLMWESSYFPPQDVARVFTYVFVHASFSHALFALVLLLALGKMVGDVIGSWSVVAIFVASTLFGALIYTILPGTPVPLYGGYPAVYGLVGAYSFILWTRLGAANDNRAKAFTLIGFLLGIQLIFGLLFGGSRDWIADIAGFVAGFGLSYLLAPGRFTRIMGLLRRR
jgi:membrane associated rhomboid family serine protease